MATSIHGLARAAASSIESLAEAGAAADAPPGAALSGLGSVVDAGHLGADAGAGVEGGRSASEASDARLDAISSDLARARLHAAAAGPGLHAGAQPDSVSSPGSDGATALADARAAHAEAAGQGEGDQLGHSTARVTVGEGDERVSLFIAVRGDSVRVEARAHAAAYAHALNQRSHELASGLADHGLALGSLSTDLPGDRASHSNTDGGGAGARSDRRDAAGTGGDADRDPDRDPNNPGRRGLRAIA